MQPVAFILRPPLGECSEVFLNTVINLASCQEDLALSALSVHIGPIHEQRGCSLVPFSSLLDLGNRLPCIRELHLRSILLPLDATHRDVVSLPRFSLLESLTIVAWFVPLSWEAALTTSLFALFLHTPLLRNLTVYAPLLRPRVERTSGPVSWPDLPFSLEKLVCIGVLSAPACAHIITRSRLTLEELKIDVPGGEDDDDAPLLGAIAQAAPRLRILDVRLRGDSLSRARPVICALSRAETLRLETPQALQDALAMLAGVSLPLRALTLSSTRHPHQPAASLPAQLISFVSQARVLRNVTLRGSYLDAEGRRALLDHCRARRIICCIHS